MRCFVRLLLVSVVCFALLIKSHIRPDHGLIIEDIKTPTERNDFRDIVNWSVDHVDSVRLLKITRRREQPN